MALGGFLGTQSIWVSQTVEQCLLSQVLMCSSRTGPLYYIYMSLLSTFSTNSINIVAGVNGLEVGQALVIALSVALNDSLYLPVWPRIAFGEPGALHEFVFMEGGPILRRGSEPLIQRHLLSLYFMGPLIGVCLGLLYHNW